MKGLVVRLGRLVLARTAMAGRGLTVFPEDVFITSYPRSGNTWVRFLVANLVWRDGSTDFKNINRRIPDIYHATDRQLLAMPRPRLLKSHEYFDPRYQKVIFVLRDVRSVVVSLYYYWLGMGDIPYLSRLGYKLPARKEFLGSVDRFAELMVDSQLAGPYGRWDEHVLSWLGACGQNPARFLYLRYEDMLAQHPPALRDIARFLDLSLPEEELEPILARCSFDTMRALMDQAGRQFVWNQEATRQDIKFVRSGRADEWQAVLNEKTLALLQENFGPVMEQLGYSQV
jgi:hypothetical protein